MSRPECTHPCHLNASRPAIADFTWTCPQCKRVISITVEPFEDPTPALVTR